MQEVKQPLTPEQDLFCTRYELETLSGIVNFNRLERWVPGFCNPHTHQEHEARYEWVKEYVKDSDVLDVACGTGFGSYKLAKEGKAAKVTGYDNDDNTIRYATLKNRHIQLMFHVQDAETFAADKQYDIIVSFETIEHLKKPDRFLNNINRALRTGGTCFISTPISNLAENDHPDNIYHEKEWGFKNFRDFVKDYLIVDEVYVQLSDARSRNSGFVSRFLHKTGLRPIDPLIDHGKPVPRKWNPLELKEELVGTEWKGYQIL